MAAPLRNNRGSQLVLATVGLGLAALGIGTIYLPFIADKDKLRGLHEEAEPSEFEKREFERYIKEMGGQTGRESLPGMPAVPEMPPGVAGIPATAPDGNHLNRRKSLPSQNSMWARMGKAAASEKK
jgi:hypothetical protein